MGMWLNSLTITCDFCNNQLFILLFCFCLEITIQDPLLYSSLLTLCNLGTCLAKTYVFTSQLTPGNPIQQFSPIIKRRLKSLLTFQPETLTTRTQVSSSGLLCTVLESL